MAEIERLIDELETTAERITRYSNSPHDGLMQAAADALREKVAECDAIMELNHKQWLSLENCRYLAARHRSEEWATNILRFCEEGGVKASPLRATAPQAAPQPTARSAIIDTGLKRLMHVVQTLLDTGRFVDDEGEDTQALADLGFELSMAAERAALLQGDAPLAAPQRAGHAPAGDAIILPDPDPHRDARGYRQFLYPSRLTRAQIEECWRAAYKALDADSNLQWSDAFARAIEAALTIGSVSTSEPAQAAPVPARTPQDYAIEHAEYMAKGAERLIAAVNDLALAEQEHDEGIANESDVDAAREAVTEAQRSLKSDVYEFRKRRDRAVAIPAEPVAAPSPSLVDAQPSDRDLHGMATAAGLKVSDDAPNVIGPRALRVLAALARTATRQADEALLEALETGRYYAASCARQFIREAGINAKVSDDKDVAKIDKAIAALRQRLDQPPAAAQGEAP